MKNSFLKPCLILALLCLMIRLQTCEKKIQSLELGNDYSCQNPGANNESSVTTDDGESYTLIETKTKTKFVLKIHKLPKTHYMYENLSKEIKFSQELDHANIYKLPFARMTDFPPNEREFITLKKSDLEPNLYNKIQGPFSLAEIRYYVLKILTAFDYLQKRNFALRRFHPIMIKLGEEETYYDSITKQNIQIQKPMLYASEFIEEIGVLYPSDLQFKGYDSPEPENENGQITISPSIELFCLGSLIYQLENQGQLPFEASFQEEFAQYANAIKEKPDNEKKMMTKALMTVFQNHKYELGVHVDVGNGYMISHMLLYDPNKRSSIKNMLKVASILSTATTTKNIGDAKFTQKDKGEIRISNNQFLLIYGVNLNKIFKEDEQSKETDVERKTQGIAKVENETQQVQRDLKVEKEVKISEKVGFENTSSRNNLPTAEGNFQGSVQNSLGNRILKREKNSGESQKKKVKI